MAPRTLLFPIVPQPSIRYPPKACRSGSTDSTTTYWRQRHYAHFTLFPTFVLPRPANTSCSITHTHHHQHERPLKHAVKERNRAGKHRGHAASFHASKGFPLSTLPVSILFRALHRFPVRQKEVDVSRGLAGAISSGSGGKASRFPSKEGAHSSTTPASPFSRHD